MKKLIGLFAVLMLTSVVLSVLPASAGIPYCWFNKWIGTCGGWFVAPTTVTTSVGVDVHWQILIRVHPPSDFGPLENVVVTDRFGAEWELHDANPLTPEWDPISITHGNAYYTTTGASAKVHLTWEIGPLAAGEMAELRFEISTDLNPAGKQEYTSPGCYELNSGAVLKFIFEGKKYSAYTLPIMVQVSP